MEDVTEPPAGEGHSGASRPGAGSSARIPTSASHYAFLVIACIGQALAAVLCAFALVSTMLTSTSSVPTKTLVFVVMLAIVLAFGAGAVITGRSASRRKIV